MTAWCDAPGSAPVHGTIEPSSKGDVCPKCGDVLLPDSKFCRSCGHKLQSPPHGMVVMPEDAATSQDGLQFLCSKYSTLITRLREEVLAHQQCQAEGRLLERRLREESQIWAQEKEQLLRDQQCLKDEIASLKIQLQGGRQQASDAASASRRCAGRELLANPGGGPMWQHEAQQKQHQQMMTLLNEHSQLQVEQRNAEDELNACRDHLSRWRRKAADLETQALDAAQGRDDAEKKARCAQEEMRQALRSLAGAKNRQKEAERLAKQEASQARDLEERLKALRYDSRQNARRANGAAGRLAVAEAMEQRANELETEVMDLQRCLHLAQSQGEEVQARHQRVEEAEERAALHAGEVKGELRAAEALNLSHVARVQELEVQLHSAREALAEAENHRATQTTWTQRLGHELADARAAEQEARQREAQQSRELHDARRRLEQVVGTGPTGGQLAQCKRRVAELEQVCERQESELAEERRARERCHMEAVKAGEKLRLARAQGAQMKDRVKSLEEAELRYPSRFPPRRHAPAAGPKMEGSMGSVGRSCSAPGLGRGPEGTRLSWEEQPRAAAPPKAELSLAPNEDVSLASLLALPQATPAQLGGGLQGCIS